LKVKINFSSLHVVYVWKNIFALVCFCISCAGIDHYINSLFNCQDLPLGLLDDIDKWCYGCLQVINEVDDVLTENRIWKLRTKDIGIVSAEDAINWGFRLMLWSCYSCSEWIYAIKRFFIVINI